ncbi:MAG: hypothetical protein QXT40_02955 [Candidatus Micrarchaeia archaeon]
MEDFSKIVKHNFAGSIAKIEKKDNYNIMKNKETNVEKKDYNLLAKLEELIENKNYTGIVHLVEKSCEGKNAVKDPTFYYKALRTIMKQQPPERYYLSVESIAQSAAIACITNGGIYEEAIDYLLTQRDLELSPFPVIQPQNIESACRLLASIAISNERMECGKIEAASAFKLALERVKTSIIANEKRVEEKPNRMVEILEQAFSAKLDPEVCRDMYEDVYTYIKSNEKLSDEYKVKTLAEITSKAIKTPGVSHTKLFIDAIAYLKEKNAGNLARSIAILLDVNKK